MLEDAGELLAVTVIGGGVLRLVPFILQHRASTTDRRISAHRLSRFRSRPGRQLVPVTRCRIGGRPDASGADGYSLALWPPLTGFLSSWCDSSSSTAREEQRPPPALPGPVLASCRCAGAAHVGALRV